MKSWLSWMPGNYMKKIEKMEIAEIRRITDLRKQDDVNNQILSKQIKEIKKTAEQIKLIDPKIKLKKLKIEVDWVYNSTWGENPHAYITIEYSDGTYENLIGKVSGYGYDKESAAIAKALNQSLKLKKILIDHIKNNDLRKSNIYKNNKLGYGSGSGVFPYFSTTGVGTKSIIDILLKLFNKKIIFKEEHCTKVDLYNFYY